MCLQIKFQKRAVERMTNENNSNRAVKLLHLIST